MLNALWKKLQNHNISPSLYEKLTLGVIVPSLGYILLALLLHEYGANKLPIWILVPLFALFVTGELLVIPSGISLACKLAPAGKQGTFVGVWSVMQGISALVSGYMAQMTVVNTHAQALGEINFQYAKVFGLSGGAIMLIGFLSWITLKRILK